MGSIIAHTIRADQLHRADKVKLYTRQLDWNSIESDEETLQWFRAASPDCILAADVAYNPYELTMTLPQMLMILQRDHTTPGQLHTSLVGKQHCPCASRCHYSQRVYMADFP